jgi:hypothetical protein
MNISSPLQDLRSLYRAVAVIDQYTWRLSIGGEVGA